MQRASSKKHKLPGLRSKVREFVHDLFLAATLWGAVRAARGAVDAAGAAGAAIIRSLSGGSYEG